MSFHQMGADSRLVRKASLQAGSSSARVSTVKAVARAGEQQFIHPRVIAKHV